MATFPDSTSLPETEVDVHPTDAIGVALARANGMLTALIACYDQRPDGVFNIPQVAVYYTLFSIEELTKDAEAELDRLNDKYDVPFHPKAAAAAVSEVQS